MEAVTAFFRELLLSFIPLFVAVDALGLVPIILGLEVDMKPRERSRMLRYAMLTALAIGLAFAFGGKLILEVLGISESHFLVAGGLILLLLAARNLLVGDRGETGSSQEQDTIGVFPIGVPLIAGPAVLTTLLVLLDRYATAPVVIAFLLNLAVAWIMFAQASRLSRFLGRGGIKAASKIAMLLLAAIAVAMVHRGILQLIEAGNVAL